jgi:hypothetical protein
MDPRQKHSGMTDREAISVFLCISILVYWGMENYLLQKQEVERQEVEKQEVEKQQSEKTVCGGWKTYFLFSSFPSKSSRIH